MSHIDDSTASKDERIVHAFSPVGKAFNAYLWHVYVGVSTIVPMLPIMYGCIAAMRREEAIIVQFIILYSAYCEGLQGGLRLYDQVNAFPSLAPSSLTHFLRESGVSRGLDLLLQHVCGHYCRLRANNGFYFCHAACIAQGSSTGTFAFNAGSIPALSDYVYDIEDDFLVMSSVVNNDAIYVGSTAFVDDVATSHIDSTPLSLCSKAGEANLAFSRNMQPHGLYQNLDKAETLFNFVGTGSLKFHKDINHKLFQIAPQNNATDTAKDVVRYLGPYFDKNPTFAQ